MSALNTSETLPVADRAAVRRAAARLVRADARLFTAALLVNVAAAAVGLLGPWFVGRMIDSVGAGEGVAAVDRWALLLGAAALTQLIVARVAWAAAYRFGERTTTRLREQLLTRILALPQGVGDRTRTGDLTARASADVGLVSTVLRDAAPEVVFAVFQLLIIVVAVLLLDPVLGLCGLAVLGGIAVALRWYLRRARPAYLAQGAARSEVAEALATTVSGARTVELLGLQESRRRVQQAMLAAERRTQLATLRLRSVFFPAIDVTSGLAVAAVVGIGGLFFLQGRTSLGTVAAAALYLRQLYGPLNALLVWTETLQSAAASFARLEGVGQVTESPPPRSVTPDGERIVVDALGYAYTEVHDVVRDVSLVVEPGERLAVVGPSGAGKTTLGRLLAGVARPRAGSVTVGGVAIADLEPYQRRQHVVMITQDHHVFAGTLRDNLRITAAEASDDDLVAALSVIDATWVGGLGDGLDTVLGADAVVLDGAQAEQLALARVVLADPHTVILDEATALLDPTAARTTERAFAAVMTGRTVIAIAHRLHTAQDADRIAVMIEGRIVELGSHDVLVARGGAYAELWRQWQA